MNSFNMNSLIKYMVDFLDQYHETISEQPVIKYLDPLLLKNKLDLSLDQNKVLLNRENKDKVLEKLIDLCQKIWEYSVHTQHPFFLNQLYANTNQIAIIGEILAVLLNTSMYTYEVAPVFTLLEEELLHRIRIIFGLDPTKSDAIFCPGGSMSNLMALHIARYYFQNSVNHQ